MNLEEELESRIIMLETRVDNMVVVMSMLVDMAHQAPDLSRGS